MGTDKRFTSMLYGLIGVSTFAMAGAACAQVQGGDGPAVASVDTAATADDAVGDIVVTARKRSENLRDVPVAITAIGGDTLARNNIAQIIDIARITPNLSVSAGAFTPFTFVRGFGSGALASFEQSVGKFVDNVSFGRDQDVRIPLFDIERVEVLKGPQVLTFGNSATVGALTVTTRKPGDSFAADGSIGYEFYGQEVQTQVGVTVPLAEGASLRIAGFFQTLDKGRYFNPLQGRHEVNTQNFAIRPTLRLAPTEGLEILLRAEVDRLREDGNGIVPIGQPLLTNRQPFPVVGDRDTRYVDYNVAPYFSDEFSRFEGELYQADVNYDLLGGTLSSTSAWRSTQSGVSQGNDGGNHAPTFFAAVLQKYKQFSQELRFNGSFGRFDVTTGGYYQRDTLLIDAATEFTLGGFGVTGLAATPVGRMTTFDQKGRSYSAFVDMTYRLTDQLSLSGGVRYANIRKIGAQAQFATRIMPNIGFDLLRGRIASFRDPAILPAYAAVFGTPEHQYPLGFFQLEENHWQPQAIVQYEVAPRNKAYFKYVRGAKVGGFDFLYTGTPATDGSFEPEYASAFEIGLKGSVLDNRVDYTFAAFRTTLTDLQQSALQNAVYVISNVGKARSQGIELGVNYRPINALRLSFNGSYLDAKFVDFAGAPCTSAQNANLAPGCTGTPRAQDISGSPTPYASKWSGTVSIDYTMPLGTGDYEMTIGASSFARSKFNAGAYDDPRMMQSGYALLDAHVDVGPADGRWSLSLFSRNITDKKPLDYATLVPGSSTAVLGNFSRGRQIGARFNFTMGK